MSLGREAKSTILCVWMGRWVKVCAFTLTCQCSLYVHMCVWSREIQKCTLTHPVWSRASPAAPRDSTKGLLYPLYDCVFPRRDRAQWGKGPRSLSPDMDVYSLYGPAEHSEMNWPSILTCMTQFFRKTEEGVGEKKRDWESWQMNRHTRQTDREGACLWRCTHMKKNIHGALHHFICSLSLH